MTEIYSEIKLIGTELDDGESIRTTCPQCRGGNSGEVSLSVTREGSALLYNCFRAACGLQGAVGGKRLVRTKSARKQGVQPFTGELYPLDDEWAAFLYERQYFDQEHIEISGVKVTSDGRCAYPIFDPMGLRRGYVLRAYDDRTPKALTRPDKAEPHSSWYLNWSSSNNNTVLVVEDIPSAVRAAKYRDSLALLGTGITAEGLDELAAHRRNVVWALDADATEQAISLHRKYGVYFDSSRVMQLPKDLKDMTEIELVEQIT